MLTSRSRQCAGFAVQSPFALPCRKTAPSRVAPSAQCRSAPRIGQRPPAPWAAAGLGRGTPGGGILALLILAVVFLAVAYASRRWAAGSPFIGRPATKRRTHPGFPASPPAAGPHRLRLPLGGCWPLSVNPLVPRRPTQRLPDDAPRKRAAPHGAARHHTFRRIRTCSRPSPRSPGRCCPSCCHRPRRPSASGGRSWRRPA